MWLQAGRVADWKEVDPEPTGLRRLLGVGRDGSILAPPPASPSQASLACEPSRSGDWPEPTESCFFCQHRENARESLGTG